VLAQKMADQWVWLRHESEVEWIRGLKESSNLIIEIMDIGLD